MTGKRKEYKGRPYRCEISIAFEDFFDASIGLKLAETGLVGRDDPWAEFEIKNAFGFPFPILYQRQSGITPDLILELEEKLPPKERAENGYNFETEKHYLAFDFEIITFAPPQFFKYVKYLILLSEYFMLSDKLKGLPAKVPSIRILVTGLLTKVASRNTPNFAIELHPVFYNMEDIDVEKRFSELQSLVAQKSPLSFENMFKLVILPFTGAKRVLYETFIERCLVLVYEAFKSQDCPLENKKHAKNFIRLFVTLYAYCLARKQLRLLLDDEEMKDFEKYYKRIRKWAQERQKEIEAHKKKLDLKNKRSMFGIPTS
ncbi:MAG: hypothetical protein LBE31_03400 [Deltaproteobacteria bacterium]|jgi:hypothetical protein|nr:hypothetical protein [Deltaproteobacteria bacterium]